MNSQQNQLTPWSNDPVSDAPGEAIYVRDEATGEVWGPTALPIRDKAASYSASHGQGYSRFEHASRGIALELLQYVPVEDSIKISRLKITNQSGRERHLSVTAYVEWVLGTSRSASAPFIVTEIDPQTGAMFWRTIHGMHQFSERVAFADLKGRQTAWTGDRTEFVGRDGGLERPLGLTLGAVLSNRVGAGLDPCGVLQTQVRLSADTTTEIAVFLGEGANRADVQALIAKYRKADLDAVFGEVVHQWDDTLGAVQVKTPDRALDILLNRWLPYQTACVPGVGARRFLSGERCLRFSRSTPGCHGALRIAPRCGAGASVAGCRPAIRRRRCSALVAAGIGARYPHSRLR